MTQAVMRCDVSAEIGAGHVMRCMALAESLSDCGVQTSLAINTDGARFIKKRTQKVILLGPTDARDACGLAQRLGSPDIFVIDHYGLGEEYERELRNLGARVVVIEDRPTRRHLANILVDATPSRQSELYASLMPATATQLLGTDYALLRKEFRKARTLELCGRRGTPVIMVAMGATDSENRSEQVLHMLKLVRRDFRLVVVLGAGAPHRDKLADAVKDWGFRARLEIEPQNIAELLTQTDIVVGAPGISASERACVGVPQILLRTASNQVDVASAFHNEGAAFDLGSVEDMNPSLVALQVEMLLDDTQLQQQMRKAARALFDGNGAARVAAIVATDARAADGGAVTIRRMKASDEEIIYSWQKHPDTRRFAREPQCPTREEHSRWMSRRIADLSSISEILIHRDRVVGMLRLDPRNDGLEVSLVVAPDCRRFGIGWAALSLAAALCPREKLLAHIFPQNVASRTLFAKAGYRQISDEFWVKPPMYSPLSTTVTDNM